MPEQFSVSEAKNRLTAIVHSVENGAAVRLTRRGKPVAVLLSIEEYQRLTGKQKDFWTALTDFRQSFEPDEEGGISGQEFEGIRDSSPGREVVL